MTNTHPTLTGAEILWATLAGEGTTTVFGYPGGAILPIYDALRKFPSIHHVLVRHEQGAAHMADGYARALMFQFLFWEQYSHETAIAVRRYHKHMRGVAEEDLDPALLTKGHRALALIEAHLARHQYFAGERLSLADVALVAYTRVAPEGGFDLAGYPAVRHWIAKVEAGLDIGEG